MGLVTLSLSLSLACGGDGLKDGVGVLDRERDEHAAQRAHGRAQHLLGFGFGFGFGLAHSTCPRHGVMKTCPGVRVRVRVRVRGRVRVRVSWRSRVRRTAT